MKQPQTHPMDRALSAARQAIGSAEDVARLRSRLGAALAAEPPPPGSSSGTASPLTAAKLWLVTGAALLAVGGWLVTREPVNGGGPAPAVLAAPGLVANGSSGAQSVPAATERMAPTDLAREHDPRAPSAAAVADASGSAQGMPAATERARKRASLKPSAAAAGAPKSEGRRPIPSPNTLSEVELISRAQAALERDPRAALSWLAQHEQQHARGLLGEERDILRFDAERALGMEERALAHARAFTSAYPSSSHRRRVEQWLIAHKNGSVPLPTH